MSIYSTNVRVDSQSQYIECKQISNYDNNKTVQHSKVNTEEIRQ
jgi:hypothetical protein